MTEHSPLLLKTAVVAATMLSCAFLPVIFTKGRRVASPVLLAGTGALLGLCCFDLVPNMIRIGGQESLILVAFVWAAYSLFHWYSHRERASASLRHAGLATFQPAPDDSIARSARGSRSRAESHVPPFLVSMLLHTFSTGVILVVSQRFAQSFSNAVFLAILTHKSFEAVVVAFMLMNQVRSRRIAFALLFAYCATFPLGVALAAYFDADLKLGVAKTLSAIGLGTLLGCLQFDFVVPCLERIRARASGAIWVVAGFVLTEWMMRLTS